MAECVAGACLGEESALGVAQPFGDHDCAIADPVDHLLHTGEERVLVEGDLGKEDDLGGVVFMLGRQSSGGGDPARMATHDLEHEDLGRGQGHRGDIEGSLANRHRDVLRDRAEAGAVVGDREVVVDGLGNTDTDERVAGLRAELRHLPGSVGGISASVVEEVADVVRPEDLDEPLVLGTRFSSRPFSL